jgi:hypothetical protein
MARSGSRVHNNKAGRRKPKQRLAQRSAKNAQRTAQDETITGGRGGRSRGTASRGRTRTTSESSGEVDLATAPVGPVRSPKRGGRGKGSKTSAPRSTKKTSGRKSSGARKSSNRPGASGTGRKKR